MLYCLTERENYFRLKYYRNVLITGTKVDSQGNYFVSLPRWKSHVPATLALIKTTDKGPVLEPFPSWEMNKIGNVTALQSVLGFEIDSEDRLWALDQGKVGGAAALEGAIKLVVFDINTRETIQTYVFNKQIASLSHSFLNDLVLDVPSRLAYIADSGIMVNDAAAPRGALLVYDFEKNRAVRVLDNVDSTNANGSVWLEVDGERSLPDGPMMTGADGIALAGDTKTLYWCPLTSRTLYSIPTEKLRGAFDEVVTETDVSVVVDKRSGSDGLTANGASSKQPFIYLTMLEENGIARYAPGSDEVETVCQSEDMVWSDTFAWTPNGSLVFVTNQLHLFLQGRLDWDGEPNYRIWRVDLGEESYQKGHSWSHSDDDHNDYQSIAVVVAISVLVLIALGIAVHLFRRSISRKKDTSVSSKSLLYQDSF